MGDVGAASTPTDGRSSPSTVVKHEDTFTYDRQMVFGGSITSPLSPYQPFAGYSSQEHTPLAFDYPNSVSTLANALADPSPFATVAPPATSGFPDEDTSAYNLSAEISELSISSPVSSPLFHAASLVSSPVSLPISQPLPTQVCDPKELDSPLTMEQHAIQAGPSIPAEVRRRSKAPSYRRSAADSDYSPSGESEVEDANDYSYGEPTNKKKTRSARVSHAAHPYPKPEGNPKDNKRRGTKLEIPVPVPGLTKNSRGRRVPKKPEGVVEDRSRPFWCPVEDCDKLFNRGEHLKRHILSIHTWETRKTLPSHSILLQR